VSQRRTPARLRSTEYNTTQCLEASIFVTRGLCHGNSARSPKQYFKGIASERISRDYIEWYTMDHVSYEPHSRNPARGRHRGHCNFATWPVSMLTSFDCWTKTTLLRESQFITQETAARVHDAISWNARQIQLEDRHASGIFLGCGYLQNDQFVVRMLCLR